MAGKSKSTNNGGLPKVSPSVLKELNQTADDASRYEAKFKVVAARHHEVRVEALRGVKGSPDAICLGCGRIYHSKGEHNCDGA